MKKLTTIFVLLAFLMAMLLPAVVAAPPDSGDNSTQSTDPDDPIPPGDDDPWGVGHKPSVYGSNDDAISGAKQGNDLGSFRIVIKVWEIRLIIGSF
jgi:hypothetical protein